MAKPGRRAVQSSAVIGLERGIMSAQVIRPDVSDLTLRTFCRALHPELFERGTSLTLSNSVMQLDVRLNASGHVLALQTASHSLTEVIVDHREVVPTFSRIIDYRLRGCKTESVQFETGLRYDVSCQLERLHLDIFLRMNEELEQDLNRADLSIRLPAANRILPGPLSLIRMEVARDSILVYAFHTFPEHSAIVKTQSLFVQNDLPADK
ncbi:DUF2617 family protein [Schlesneria sp.]|uniref:DUF2617 family protein n=1 Tax=Schlesneria sp. TaxID=2762018 RepID=UPI002EE3617B